MRLFSSKNGDQAPLMSSQSSAVGNKYNLSVLENDLKALLSKCNEYLHSIERAVGQERNIYNLAGQTLSENDEQNIRAPYKGQQKKVFLAIVKCLGPIASDIPTFPPEHIELHRTIKELVKMLYSMVATITTLLTPAERQEFDELAKYLKPSEDLKPPVMHRSCTCRIL